MALGSLVIVGPPCKTQPHAREISCLNTPTPPPPPTAAGQPASAARTLRCILWVSETPRQLVASKKYKKLFFFFFPTRLANNITTGNYKKQQQKWVHLSIQPQFLGAAARGQHGMQIHLYKNISNGWNIRRRPLIPSRGHRPHHQTSISCRLIDCLAVFVVTG